MTDKTFRRLSFGAWLALAATGLYLAASCSGCAVASWKRVAPQQTDQDAQVTQQIDNLTAAVATVSSQVQNTSKQIQNDLWPIVVIVGLVVVVGGLVLALTAFLGMRLIRSWIKSHSYLEQKPVYEKCRPTPSEPV